jgi:hypothetical protein
MILFSSRGKVVLRRRRGRRLSRPDHRAGPPVLSLAGRSLRGGGAQTAVDIDLSEWSAKYFPPQIVQYAKTLLQDKSDVRSKILKHNAARLLGLVGG